MKILHGRERVRLSKKKKEKTNNNSGCGYQGTVSPSGSVVQDGKQPLNLHERKTMKTNKEYAKEWKNSPESSEEFIERIQQDTLDAVKEKILEYANRNGVPTDDIHYHELVRYIRELEN